MSIITFKIKAEFSEIDITHIKENPRDFIEFCREITLDTALTVLNMLKPTHTLILGQGIEPHILKAIIEAKAWIERKFFCGAEIQQKGQPETIVSLTPLKSNDAIVIPYNSLFSPGSLRFLTQQSGVFNLKFSSSVPALDAIDGIKQLYHQGCRHGVRLTSDLGVDWFTTFASLLQADMARCELMLSDKLEQTQIKAFAKHLPEDNCIWLYSDMTYPKICCYVITCNPNTSIGLINGNRTSLYDWIHRLFTGIIVNIQVIERELHWIECTIRIEKNLPPAASSDALMDISAKTHITPDNKVRLNASAHAAIPAHNDTGSVWALTDKTTFGTPDWQRVVIVEVLQQSVGSITDAVLTADTSLGNALFTMVNLKSKDVFLTLEQGIPLFTLQAMMYHPAWKNRQFACHTEVQQYQKPPTMVSLTQLSDSDALIIIPEDPLLQVESLHYLIQQVGKFALFFSPRVPPISALRIIKTMYQLGCDHGIRLMQTTDDTKTWLSTFASGLYLSWPRCELMLGAELNSEEIGAFATALPSGNFIWLSPNMDEHKASLFARSCRQDIAIGLHQPSSGKQFQAIRQMFNGIIVCIRKFRALTGQYEYEVMLSDPPVTSSTSSARTLTQNLVSRVRALKSALAGLNIEYETLQKKQNSMIFFRRKTKDSYHVYVKEVWMSLQERNSWDVNELLKSQHVILPTNITQRVALFVLKQIKPMQQLLISPRIGRDILDLMTHTQSWLILNINSQIYHVSDTVPQRCWPMGLSALSDSEQIHGEGMMQSSFWPLIPSLELSCRLTSIPEPANLLPAHPATLSSTADIVLAASQRASAQMFVSLKQRTKATHANRVMFLEMITAELNLKIKNHMFYLPSNIAEITDIELHHVFTQLNGIKAICFDDKTNVAFAKQVVTVLPKDIALIAPDTLPASLEDIETILQFMQPESKLIVYKPLSSVLTAILHALPEKIIILIQREQLDDAMVLSIIRELPTQCILGLYPTWSDDLINHMLRSLPEAATISIPATGLAFDRVCYIAEQLGEKQSLFIPTAWVNKAYKSWLGTLMAILGPDRLKLPSDLSQETLGPCLSALIEGQKQWQKVQQEKWYLSPTLMPSCSSSVYVSDFAQSSESSYQTSSSSAKRNTRIFESHHKSATKKACHGTTSVVVIDDTYHEQQVALFDSRTQISSEDKGYDILSPYQPSAFFAKSTTPSLHGQVEQVHVSEQVVCERRGEPLSLIKRTPKLGPKAKYEKNPCDGKATPFLSVTMWSFSSIEQQAMMDDVTIPHLFN